jgi:hypothetical protein
MPKFIELNSELILVLGFGLGPNIYFFCGEKSGSQLQSKLQLLFVIMAITFLN